MATYQNAKELSKLTLGQHTDYVGTYTPELLQPVPRSLNRDDLDIDQQNLPFAGEDVWYGYELSWLNNQGKPQVAVAEFRFDCNSPNIVESKSFKLYLNSFNQSKFEHWQQVQQRLIADLSATSGTAARVTLFAVDDCKPLSIVSKQAHCIDKEDITVETYQYTPQLLDDAIDQDGEYVSESLTSHLLKSNCLITNQPDWATLYIDYKGPKINHKQLLKYIISFREHNEFHEQCVERIFTDIKHRCLCEDLTVYARYTRRGGLDINPFRSTRLQEALPCRTIRQ